jgi:hypothetical protein
MSLTDEHLRALRFLARHRGGCTEMTLLEQALDSSATSYLRGSPSYEQAARARGFSG